MDWRHVSQTGQALMVIKPVEIILESSLEFRCKWNMFVHWVFIFSNGLAVNHMYGSKTTIH